MVNLNETGRLIATCRKEKQLTQKQLGEKLHVTDRAVSKWETGKAFPDVHIMEDLCRELGISVSELIAGKRIEEEQYQEETEKMLMVSVGQTQLMGFQIVIYILFLMFVTALRLLFILKKSSSWTAPSMEMILCGMICLGTCGCYIYLDKKLPARLWRISNPVLEGAVGGGYFLLLMGIDYCQSGGMKGMMPGEQGCIILIILLGLLFSVLIRVGGAKNNKSKWEKQNRDDV